MPKSPPNDEFAILSYYEKLYDMLDFLKFEPKIYEETLNVFSGATLPHSLYQIV